MGRPRKYTDAHLLDAIRTMTQALGRTPRHDEIVPNITAFRTRFGTWRRACLLAGVAPRGHGGARAHHRELTTIDEARRDAERVEAIKLYWFTRGVVGTRSSGRAAQARSA